MINQENLKAAFDPYTHVLGILSTAEAWYNCKWWQFRRKARLLKTLRQEISIYRGMFGPSAWKISHGTKK